MPRIIKEIKHSHMLNIERDRTDHRVHFMFEGDTAVSLFVPVDGINDSKALSMLFREVADKLDAEDQK